MNSKQQMMKCIVVQILFMLISMVVSNAVDLETSRNPDNSQNLSKFEIPKTGNNIQALVYIH